MSQQDKRLLPRIDLSSYEADSHLSIEANAVEHPIRALRDISSAGISFYLDDSIEPNTWVTLNYKDPKIALKVNGRVAWTSGASGADGHGNAKFAHLYGIELLSPMMLYAVMVPPTTPVAHNRSQTSGTI